MSNRVPFPKWVAPEGGKRPPELQILARNAWAQARIISWEKRGLQEEDYNFKSWAGSIQEKGRSVENGHFPLRFGVCYEYAREGSKLRGLMLLASQTRARASWEFGPMNFLGLEEDDVRNVLEEMFDSLAALANPLAANISFGEVWKTQRELECGLFDSPPFAQAAL